MGPAFPMKMVRVGVTETDVDSVLFPVKASSVTKLGFGESQLYAVPSTMIKPAHSEYL